MRLFFKFLAVFVGLSHHIFSEEEIQYVKVEVAAIIWENQKTTESFEKVEEYTLANEVLALEQAEDPQINLETIELAQGQIKIDPDYIEEIFFNDVESVDENQTESIKPPKIYRIIDEKNHELNGTMRRISKIENLELTDHKSWFQPLNVEDESPFILVSSEENQCIVKVFQSRYPRIHAKCVEGPDALKNAYIMSKSEFNVKPLIGEFSLKNISTAEEEKVENILYLLDEQRRISLNEFHYFDHPKVGLLVGVYKYPKEEN